MKLIVLGIILFISFNVFAQDDFNCACRCCNGENCNPLEMGRLHVDDCREGCDSTNDCKKFSCSGDVSSVCTDKKRLPEKVRIIGYNDDKCEEEYTKFEIYEKFCEMVKTPNGNINIKADCKKGKVKLEVCDDMFCKKGCKKIEDIGESNTCANGFNGFKSTMYACSGAISTKFSFILFALLFMVAQWI